MKVKLTTTSAAATLLILVAGCVSPTIKTTRLNPGPNATATKEVTVFRQGEPGPSNYEVMGVVTAYGTPAAKAASKATLKKLQAEAAVMGADALVGYYTELKMDVEPQKWASALAVRTLPAGQLAASRRGDALVVMPHSLLDKDVATGGRAEKLDKGARRFAQLFLAQKGYYAIPTNEPMPDPFEGTFQTMDEAGLAKYGGPETDLVLGIQFVEKTGVFLVLVSGHGETLETALYSKSQKKVTWHNTGTGAAATGLFINMLATNAKKLMAIHAALQKAFETLPDISTTTKR